MSLSGGLLILALFLGKPVWRDRLSRQWQYYVWLIVILRLLLPFGPETGLLERAFRIADRAEVQFAPVAQAPSEGAYSAAGGQNDRDAAAAPPEETPEPQFLRDAGALLAGRLWLIWLAGALGLLIRKITAYQGFVRCVRMGMTPVSDVEMLDCLALEAERLGVRRPVELCVMPLVSSPMLIGFFRPCVVLPSADLPGTDFRYVVLHELTHCRRGDLAYKWLVQLTVCLHWFNPLVHLMGREIGRACEFSCDEAVLAGIEADSARAYGQTLLNAMASVGRRWENSGAVTLSERKELLKERLRAIMEFKRKPAAVRVLTGLLTLCVALGAAFLGTCPAAAKVQGAAERGKAAAPLRGEGRADDGSAGPGEGDRSPIWRYYDNGSLPLFQMAFCGLDGVARGEWLDRLCADGSTAFLSVALDLLEADSAPVPRLAERAYAEGDIAVFSVLAAHMGEDALEDWLDRALEDGSWAFQSVLAGILDREEDFDAREKEREEAWERDRAAEYEAVGVTVEGKDYRYRDQLVRVFLDMRANRSFFTLDMNPRGTVDVRILRDREDRVTGAAPMTEAEVLELLGEDDSELIPVDRRAVAAGESVFLGEYTLSAGDRIAYDVSAERGPGMQVFFARDGRQDTAFWSVHNLRQPKEPLRCAAEFTVAPPAEPGTYRLYLRAPEGALSDVRGTISIYKK